eukprot:3844831-Heterocapsa_arctica.AAC.1
MHFKQKWSNRCPRGDPHTGIMETSYVDLVSKMLTIVETRMLAIRIRGLAIRMLAIRILVGLQNACNRGDPHTCAG